MRQELITTIKQAVATTKTLIPLPRLLAFIEVESGGRGFGDTGKLILQYEPLVFSKATGIPRSTLNKYKWDENTVDVQSKEWEAFNEAFSINPEEAMKSTSWGLPQIMGFNHKQAGYASVGDMLDDFKRGELNQVCALIRFIEGSSKLYKAIMAADYETCAYVYNGTGHAQLAKRLGVKPYPDKLKEAEAKYKNMKL